MKSFVRTMGSHPVFLQSIQKAKPLIRLQRMAGKETRDDTDDIMARDELRMAGWTAAMRVWQANYFDFESTWIRSLTAVSPTAPNGAQWEDYDEEMDHVEEVFRWVGRWADDGDDAYVRRMSFR